MPIRLALALCLSLALTGCMTQRDSADPNADDGMAEEDPMGVDTAMTHGGMPNVPVYLDGAWDFNATQIDGDETMTGTLTIAEEQGASRVLTSTGVDAPLVIEEMDMSNANFTLSGTLQTANGPVPVSLVGSLAGDEMTAEAEVEGLGTYALTGTRRGE